MKIDIGKSELVGDKNTIAFEYKIDFVSKGVCYGVFFLWIKNSRIGDPEDTTHLNGCFNWIADLPKEILSLQNDSLYNGEKDLVFKELMSIYETSSDSLLNKFHITHIGMSSFDGIHLLLVKNTSGLEKFIWEVDGGVFEAYFPENQLENLVREATPKFDEYMAEAEIIEELFNSEC